MSPGWQIIFTMFNYLWWVNMALQDQKWSKLIEKVLYVHFILPDMK